MDLFSYASMLVVNTAICLLFLGFGHSTITEAAGDYKESVLGYGLLLVGILQAFNVIYSITVFLRRDEGGDIWIQ